MEKGEMGENATGRLATYYVAECMEFNRYGEYREDIQSAEEAVKYYQSIPSERLNAGKGIGLHVEEEDGIPLDFPLVSGGKLDVDFLGEVYGFKEYPELLRAARELSAYLPETKVVDTKGILTKKSMDAADFADEMIKLEKNLDPDFYHTFYPKEAEHKEAIIWKALCQDGKEEYIRWLGSKIFEQKSELKEQADKLKTTLEQVKLIPPVDLKPFVYVRISEHPDIPLEEAMPLNQAVELFGKLDRQSVEEKDMAGYYKTHFEICFLSEGEVMSYTGRQDFGDGEGNLLDHVKAFADYYLHTEEGQQLMKQTARTTEEWEHEQQQMKWVLEEMLPSLQYFCNLEKLETAVLEEQEIEKKVPLLTQGDASRKAYQEAILAYVRESRIALNTGKELPCMPDIRDFATACPDKSYREQVMEEIRQEAESYGMTVEAYVANGYEPPKRGGR